MTNIRTTRGAVAQLVRVPDCRSGGCGFKSRRPRLHNIKRGNHLWLPRFSVRGGVSQMFVTVAPQFSRAGRPSDAINDLFYARSGLKDCDPRTIVPGVVRWFERRLVLIHAPMTICGQDDRIILANCEASPVSANELLHRRAEVSVIGGTR